jgi:hypothetical protein
MEWPGLKEMDQEDGQAGVCCGGDREGGFMMCSHMT